MNTDYQNRLREDEFGHIINAPRREIDQRPFIQFSIAVLHTVCVAGAVTCLVAPIVSDDWRQYKDEMKIGKIFFVCMAFLTKMMK